MSSRTDPPPKATLAPSAVVGAEIRGERYSATVPDTLDLAERARLALNGLARARDPERGYQQYFYILLNAQPPYMLHSGAPDSSCDAMVGEAFPLMRLMSGENAHREAEEGLYK